MDNVLGNTERWAAIIVVLRRAASLCKTEHMVVVLELNSLVAKGQKGAKKWQQMKAQDHTEYDTCKERSKETTGKNTSNTRAVTEIVDMMR